MAYDVEGMIIRVFEEALIRDVRPTDKCYRYIPYDINKFVKLVKDGRSIWFHYRHDRKTCPPKFLDVGCGIGTTLIAARLILVQVFGLEINPQYAEIAKKLTRDWRGEHNIIEGDARTFDYHDFDIVYYYSPMHDHKDNVQIAEKAYKEAKVGTVFLNMQGEHPQLHSFGGERIRIKLPKKHKRVAKELDKFYRGLYESREN